MDCDLLVARTCRRQLCHLRLLRCKNGTKAYWSLLHLFAGRAKFGTSPSGKSICAHRCEGAQGVSELRSGVGDAMLPT